jgi:predicted amidohydrolase
MRNTLSGRKVSRSCVEAALIALFLTAGLSAGGPETSAADRSVAQEGWQQWTPRPELAPRCYIDPFTHRSPPDSLAISGNSNASAYGGWERTYEVQAGKHYRAGGYYRTQSVKDPRRQIFLRLDWLDAGNKRVAQPDYAYQTEAADDGWTKVSALVPAPENSAKVKLELALGWSPLGSVWWDDLSFEEAPAPAPRPVKIGSISLRPNQTGGKDQSVQAFLDALDQAGREKPDIVCLGEGITIIGHSGNFVSVAETVPGPTTEKLGGKARQYGMYIVAGIYEREGNAIYNTAVLIDRQGRLAGKYRKVYLPREEIEGGLTPGESFPVFRTDFGTVGIMICWDSQYTDPARALAAQGAEMILVPIWGGNLTLMKARAIENHVFLVSAGYDIETAVINPVGEVLHATRQPGVIKTITVDLNERLLDAWLGDMGARFFKEMRWDQP